MAKLTKIWLDERMMEFRLDWDNDRHQAIHLQSLDAKHIEEGLVRASIELNEERRREEI
jgi:hypothetical protein